VGGEEFDAVADEVHGGLEAGGEQLHRDAGELVLGEPLPVVVGVYECGEDVVAGVAAQVREVAQHPLLQCLDVALGAAEPRVGQRLRVARRG
jgi:hypothetical protein